MLLCICVDVFHSKEFLYSLLLDITTCKPYLDSVNPSYDDDSQGISVKIRQQFELGWKMKSECFLTLSAKRDHNLCKYMKKYRAILFYSMMGNDNREE